MRRCVYLAIPVLSLGLFACEDGPNQTYSPATGTLFNSGGTLATTDDAGAPIELDGGYQTYAGSTKQEVCGGGELQQQWQKMVQMPIAPPRFYAGLDMAGGDKYPGILLSQAVNGPIPLPNSTEPNFIKTATHPTRLCQYTVEGVGGNSSDVGGSITVHWGNNSEVQMEYVTSTTKDYFFQLNPGYEGGADWSYAPPDGTTSPKMYNYHWQINSAITKTPADGSAPSAPFVIDWNVPPVAGSTKLKNEIDELYRGLVSTFAPDLYSPTESPCYIAGTCGIFGPVGDPQGHWEFAFRPISFYVYTGNASVSDTLGNTVQGMYSFNIKFAPYSLANSYLTLAACGTGTATPLCPFDQGQTYPLYSGGTATTSPVPALAANVGPVAYVTGLGDKMTNCVLKLNDTFQTLLDNCINTSNDPATNTLTLNKIEGNLTHDDQNYTFSVVGINQNYRPIALQSPPAIYTSVVQDGDVPVGGDTADDFFLDTRAAGPIENDAYPVVAADNSVSWTKDYHGSGAVMREYQRLVQTTLATEWVQQFGGTGAVARSLHDPNCLFPATFATDPTFNASSFVPPAGCTGFEGLVTSGPSDPPVGTGMSAVDDMFNLYNSTFGAVFAGAQGAVPGAYEDGFKPGSIATEFCNDPGTYTSCHGDLIFSDSLAQVVNVMGQGDPTKVPLDGRDVRFYFRMYEIAKAEYMHSPESMKRGQYIGCKRDAKGVKTCAGAPEIIDPTKLPNSLDLDYEILDAIGGGASQAEYVDFTNATATADPISIDDRVIVPATNLQSEDFFQRLDREERAMFNAMATNVAQPSWAYLKTASGALQMDDNTPSHPMNNATMLLTNVFGSATLASVGFSAPSSGNDMNGNPIPIPAPATYVNPCASDLSPGNKDAYYCATHNDTDCGPHAPTDIKGNLLVRENGKPLLDGYCGAFQNTEFTVGTTSPMQLLETNQLQQTAQLIIPVLPNPYFQGAYDTTTIDYSHQPEVIVPWTPSQEGVGFPVAFDGQQDVFVQTAALDFSGQVITPVLDYMPVPTTTDGGTITNISIQAVEAEDFVGDVFLCYDSTTTGRFGDASNPGDLLNVHLYTSVNTILAWLAAHPNATTRGGSCGIIIRYTPFNNYVDYIQSTTNGVRLGVEQGGGGGRVGDATLFVPGSGVQASQ